MSWGRPPMYENPEELQIKIIQYFQDGFRTKQVPVKDKQGKIVDSITIPYITISDLCIYLGFCSRQSFYDYEQKDGFAYTIKKARLFIEREYEEMLHTNPTGAIFALKNFGWTDKQTIDQNTNISADDTLSSLINNITK